MRNKNYINQAFYLLSKFKYNLAISYFISVIIYFGVVIPADTFNLPSKVIGLLNENILITITSINSVLMFIFWYPARKYWNRYKNSYNLLTPPFLLVDYVFSFFLFITILFILFNHQLPQIPKFAISYVVVNLLFAVAWLVITYYFKHSDSDIDKIAKNEFSSDSPINEPEQDILGRNRFVENLYKEIIGLKFDNSFVFGLYGKWGEGKTSVINLLIKKFKRDSDYIYVNFQPWRFKNEDVIFNALYAQIEDTVANKYLFPNFQRAITRYKRKLSLGFSNIGLNFGFEFDFEKDSIDQMRLNVEKNICQLGKKIVIFIDDIDRLREKEILYIFQAVKSHMMFKNIIFVLSLDEDIVSMKLEKHGGNNYLAKIIQKPVQLPAPDPNAINSAVFFSDHSIPYDNIHDFYKIKSDKLLSLSGVIESLNPFSIYITNNIGSRIEIVLSADYIKSINEKDYSIGDNIFISGRKIDNKIFIDIPEGMICHFRLSFIDNLFYELFKEDKVSVKEIKLFDKGVSMLFRTHLSKVIKTLRDVKRFTNSLQSSLPPIIGEINLKDFVLLEILKVYYSPIYRDIFENWWFYVSERFENDYYNSPFTFSLSSQKEKDKEDKKKHIEDLVNRYSNKRDSMLCYSIIKELFPKILNEPYENDERRKKSISSQSFIKYFTLDIPKTEMSDIVIDKIFKKWRFDKNTNSIVSTFKDIQKTGKLKELIIKINRDYLIDIEPYLANLLIKSIYLYSKNFQRVGSDDFYNSEYDKALGLMFNLLDTKINKNQINKKVSEIVLNTEDFHFASHTVLFCNKERGGSWYNVYDSVNIEEIRQILYLRLEDRYINKSYNIFDDFKLSREWAHILYQWASSFSTFDVKNREIVNNYLLRILNNDPLRLVNFIDLQRSGGFKDETRNVNLKEFSKIYDPEGFSLLASKYIESDALNLKQRNILKSFLKLVKDSKVDML